MLHGDVTVFMF